MKGYEFDISKLAENSIIMKGQINDVVKIFIVPLQSQKARWCPSSVGRAKD